MEAFNSPIKLTEHMALHNTESRKIMENQISFKCPHCPKEYPSDRVLKRHLSVHTGENPFKNNNERSHFR